MLGMGLGLAPADFRRVLVAPGRRCSEWSVSFW